MLPGETLGPFSIESETDVLAVDAQSDLNKLERTASRHTLRQLQDEVHVEKVKKQLKDLENLVGMHSLNPKATLRSRNHFFFPVDKNMGSAKGQYNNSICNYSNTQTHPKPVPPKPGTAAPPPPR